MTAVLQPTSPLSSLTPTEAELSSAVRGLRLSSPELGALRLLEQLRAQHGWTLSEKRLKKVSCRPREAVLSDPTS